MYLYNSLSRKKEKFVPNHPTHRTDAHTRG